MMNNKTFTDLIVSHRYLSYYTGFNFEIDWNENVTKKWFISDSGTAFKGKAHKHDILWPTLQDRTKDGLFVEILPVTYESEEGSLHSYLLDVSFTSIVLSERETDVYEFLDFHFGNYEGRKENFLIFIDTATQKYYLEEPIILILETLNIAKNWVNERTNEIQKIRKNFIELERHSQKVEMTTELDAELEKTGHKVVLLHELGVIEHLQKLCKEKNPTMSDTKFAELIGLILGLQGKKIEAVRKGISGYGQGTKDNPKTLKALNKVKSELLKFGIEL